MDLEPSEEQRAIAALAREIFVGRVTPERLKEIEAGAERYDAGLWADLARANLLGVGIPAELGGSDGGLMEICALLEEQGRAVAPAPLWPTLVLGALPVARFGTAEQRARVLPAVASGESILTAALPVDGGQPQVEAAADGGAWRLEGVVPLVPAAAIAAHVVVPAGTAEGVGLFLVETRARGLSLAPQRVTGGEIRDEVAFDGAPAERLGDAGEEAFVWLSERALAGLCAVQAGVCDAALRLTATYVSGREQFERPLGSFQAVQQRLADAYVDVEAMRWTAWQAAWRLGVEVPASEEVAIAKFWAADGGARVAATAQHLHGGMGVDVDYPLHRYTLWAKQIELALGSAAHQLARLGGMLAG